VSYALRSGGNNVHGSLFEFLRNSAMDANGFNANKPASRSRSSARNQFGFTVGGPSTSPSCMTAHNKTFFFASYEGLRDSNAGSYTGTMPTALERKGFSRGPPMPTAT